MKWCFFIFALVACSHIAKKEPTDFSAKDFWQDQALRKEKLNYLSARLKIHYEGTKENLSGDGRIVANLPTEFRLEIRDLFGRIQNVMIVDSKNFVAFYPTQRLAYRDDREGGLYIKKLLGADYNVTDLGWIFLGILPPGHTGSFEQWQWTGDKGLYQGQLHLRQWKASVFVDPQVRAIRELELAAGNKKVKISYTDFEHCCESQNFGAADLFRMAKSVTTENLDASTALDIEWKDFRVSKEPNPGKVFQLKLPSQTRTILLNPR